MSKRIRIVRGSGNVFLDVGFPTDEAHSLLLRADLMLQVDRFVRDSGMTKQRAAKSLRVTQPRLNQLLKHRIELFSLDALVKMLANGGMRVELRVTKAA
jgi:predicted XRE-type DNA-binding protein